MESGEPNSHSNPFQSTSCPKSYSRKPSLKEHIQRQHTDGESKSYSCTKCMDNKQLAKTFATKKHLRQHMARVHGSLRLKCQVCFKTFSNKSDLYRHQNIHNQSIEKRYKCDLCSKILSSKQALQKHLFCSHRQKSEGAQYFACKICPSEFSGRCHLERHILEKHVVDKECECVVCSKKFIDQEALEKHIRQHDKPTQYFCDICSKGFKARRNLFRHLGVVHQKFFYCCKCSRSYGNKFEFDQHSNPKTSVELKLLAFNCQMCGESLDSQCNLDIHTNSHLSQIKSETSDDHLKNEEDTKPATPVTATPNLTQEFQCELCSKSFDRETYFAVHRNQVHPNAEWTCSFQQCSKAFKMWYQLRNHKLTHLKPFACTLCRQVFYDPKQFKDHELSHLEHKKYKCQVCPKSFETPSHLKVHVANKHGGPKPSFDRETYFTVHRNQVHPNAEWTCSFQQCSKTFKMWSQLRRHKLTHLRTKPFACTLCRRTFYQPKQLKDHELNHLTDKKYKCEMCPNSFARPFELRVHVANNHGGPKPFKCPFKNCGTCWVSNYQLKRHLISHKIDKSFKCEYCTKFMAFKTLIQLKQHHGRVHLKKNQANKNRGESLGAKQSGALVFRCNSNKCSFETLNQKEIAIHYYEQHQLPKVLILRNYPLALVPKETP